MTNQGSVAPRERVNITYRPATGDAAEEVELPFKMLMIGDFKGEEDRRPVEDRAPISVDKDNFARVLEEQELSLNVVVKDRLSSPGDTEVSVGLTFASLRDFSPEGLAEQIPDLRVLLDLREALTALKGPLGNLPAFRRKIQESLVDQQSRGRLVAELASANGDAPSPGGDHT